MKVTDAERRAALVARHHLDRSANDVLTATRDLVALHSSDPITPHLALFARVPAYRADQLDELQPHTLWRLHAMRRTLWVAATDEVAMLDASVGRKVAARERQRLLGWIERKDAEAWLARLEQQVLEAVRTEPGVPTRSLSQQIPELATKVMMGSGKWAAEMAIGPKLLFAMAMELKLARTGSMGTWKGSQYGWCAPPEVQPLQPEQARRQLVGRYLERFGPVTTVDVRWWTGMTASAVKKALKQLHAIAVELEEGVGWMLPDQVLPTRITSVDLSDEAGGVALLPGLDPTPMGYKERDWFLGPHQQALFDRNGNVGPTIWLNGRIVGGWAVDADGRVLVELLEAVARAGVDAEAARVEAWLDGVSVTPRFRTPLEKKLTS